ncbi:hypothetical protein EVAR_49342_1 [Eumeta japonica]|uniref:Uncharacterized protein n=1 Tax=Eumeta variegata TaxID=151549 RepID=A0A4C1XV68_EUMVA|nr:hypothetical protein EVAR_49342_1 [Eumeta japonica]
MYVNKLQRHVIGRECGESDALAQRDELPEVFETALTDLAKHVYIAQRNAFKRDVPASMRRRKRPNARTPLFYCVIAQLSSQLISLYRPGRFNIKKKHGKRHSRQSGSSPVRAERRIALTYES